MFLANFYLYDHEMKWLSLVRDLLQRFPPALQTHMGKFPHLVVETIIDIEDQEYLLQHATAGQIGDAVLYVLFWFQFMARYVDDIIGPNKFIRRLVHTTDTLLGGLLKGFYPPYLNLKETKSADADGPHAPRQCHALDVTIVSKPVTTSKGDVVMFASTQHYDKRREPCFSGLPVSSFGHVSSNVADSVHSSVQISALQRRVVACGDLDNFVKAVAHMVLELINRGYSSRRVWGTVKRFVMSAARKYGETNSWYVYACIYHEYCTSDDMAPPFTFLPGQPPNRDDFYQKNRRTWHKYKFALPR